MPRTAPRLDPLSPRQRDLLSTWLPGLVVEDDMSWGLVETTVLRVAAGGRTLVVKAGGERDHHIAREVRAHREWTGPWLAADRVGRLVHADVDARLLVTTYQPGRLVQDDDAAVADPRTYEQAGRLLAALHGQLAVEDDGYEARANARAERWLAGEHRIAPADVERLRTLIRSWPTPPAVVVPTHGDWQARNWLVDDGGTVRVIDLGRAELRPAMSDLDRLASREFRRYPGAEEAFLAGYGHDPREPGAWSRSRVREAIGTACWAYQVGDDAFEAQGHRLVSEALNGTGGARPASP
ncbi:aminoglycoside phosphotransferase family protein [Isoptericola sp. NPDC057391]|uniref:aminoglycoside phosphotransferase family protein n=1 Tax=Isoptericola sp. NPDC057391 TaxID=3346117 RepID=UPI00362603BA